MQEYVRLHAGHMAFLIRALDGDPSQVAASTLPDLPTAASQALAQDAVRFLRRTNFDIDPRKKWPDGGMPKLAVRGRIEADLQARPGKALCNWGDAGFGDLVRSGKHHAGRFDDELVQACVELVRSWSPDPAPTWVTCIPSRRHPDLVPDFARRLATALVLPFHETLDKTDDRPPQKAMNNSTQQARSVDGSLAVRGGPIPDGPVLLIDDMVDSRWTFTLAAWLLRGRGSGPVFPLALAQAGYDE